jgi:hypothetical protein
MPTNQNNNVEQKCTTNAKARDQIRKLGRFPFLLDKTHVSTHRPQKCWQKKKFVRSWRQTIRLFYSTITPKDLAAGLSVSIRTLILLFHTYQLHNGRPGQEEVQEGRSQRRSWPGDQYVKL